MDGVRGNCLYVDNFCKKPNAGTAGVCTKVPDDAGIACGNRYDVFPDCPNDMFCKGPRDAGVGTCELLAGLNEPCQGANPPFGTSPGCTDFFTLYCDQRPDAGATPPLGLCHARAPAGQECGTATGGVQCAFGTLCNTFDVTDGGPTFCEALRANGAACVAREQCASEYCPLDGGGCSVLRPQGAPCTGDTECEGRVCDLATNTCAVSCAEVRGNDAGGCMNYDLKSLSGFLFFALVLVPGLRRRRGR